MFLEKPQSLLTFFTLDFGLLYCILFACYPVVSITIFFFYSRSQVILRIECKTDGVWNFPITLIGTEPDVDGVINVAGTRLLKEAVTKLWLSSGKR